MMEILNVGKGNVVLTSRILAIVKPNSAPMRRMKREAQKVGKIIDVTEGKPTRSFVILDTGHIVLSPLLPSTLMARLKKDETE